MKKIGEKAAIKISNAIGSWWFIGIQTLILVLWVILNSTGILVWDTFPYIFLNLFLSFVAAYSAPLILISASAMENKDRKKLLEDLMIDKKTHKLVEESSNRLQEIETKINFIINQLNNK